MGEVKMDLIKLYLVSGSGDRRNNGRNKSPEGINPNV